MNEMISFDNPTRVIVHFKQDEDMAERMGARVVRYQVILGDNHYSPSGDYIRFNSAEDCEIHGWVKVSDLVIDESLEVQIDGEWKKAA